MNIIKDSSYFLLARKPITRQRSTQHHRSESAATHSEERVRFEVVDRISDGGHETTVVTATSHVVQPSFLLPISLLAASHLKAERLVILNDTNIPPRSP